MGEVEENIVKTVQRDPTVRLPDKVLNAPQLWMGLELYWEGFQKLTTCRQIGMGEGAIPWTAISQYCRDYNIEGDGREEFEYLIGKMDAEYLKVQREKAERRKPDAPPRQPLKANSRRR